MTIPGDRILSRGELRPTDEPRTYEGQLSYFGFPLLVRIRTRLGDDGRTVADCELVVEAA